MLTGTNAAATAGRSSTLARTRSLRTIESISEIPSFDSEAEEADFWSTHKLSDRLWESLPPVPDEDLPRTRARSTVRRRRYETTVRLDGDVLRRVQQLAGSLGLRSPELMERFIIERLYEEERRRAGARERAPAEQSDETPRS
jgi:hypothetical protein